MKIGLFNDSFPPTIDGVANTVKNYADILSARGDTPVVVTPKYPNITDSYPYEVYRYSSLKFKGRMPYRVGNCFEPKAIYELHSENFDLMHVHCPFASALLAKQINIRAGKKRIPTVFTYHTKFDIEINKYVKFEQFEKICNKFIMNNIKIADEVWAVTDGAGKWLQKAGYKGDYVVMPNGTDFRKGVSEASEVKRIKDFWKIGDEKVMLFVGRMMWHKNAKLIIDTVKKLSVTDLKFKMVFVGDGVDRVAIEEYARQTGVSDRCVFTGAVYDREALRTYYSMADIFFFPSTFDTSGLVVKEAAACKCPSLLIKDSCAAEGNRDGFSCVISEESADDCAEKLYKVLKDDDLLEVLGENAYEHVYLSWEDAVSFARRRYEKVIEEFNSAHPIRR